MKRGILVFLAVALADTLWTHYIVAASSGRAFLAALYSALIVLTGAFTTMAFVRDRIYILPAILGAFIGTFFSVR